MYLSIDVEYVGVGTEGREHKKFGNAMYCNNSVRLWSHGSVNASVEPWLSEQSSLTYLVS